MEIQRIFSKWLDYVRINPKFFILSTAAIGTSLLLLNQVRSDFLFADNQIRPKIHQRRKLGNSENIFRIVKQTVKNGKLETVQLVGHALATKIHGKVNEDLLKNALVWVVKVHPLLYHKVVGTEWDKSYFEPIDDSSITPEAMPVIMDEYQETDEYYTDTKWNQVLEGELDDPKLNETVWPYFRVHCLKNTDNANEFVLVISFLHAVEDAISSLKFMEDLLFAMDQLSRNISLPVVERKAPVPSQDQLLSKYDKEFWVKMLWSKIKGLQPLSFWMTKENEEEEPFTCPDAVPRGATQWVNRSTGMTLRSLPREFSEKLLAACREKGATVHGALSAAMIINSAAILRSKFPELSQKFPQGMHVSHVQSMSVRPYIGVSNHVIGLFVSGVGGSFKNISEESSFWEIAKQVKQQIQDSIQSKEFAILWKMAASGIDKDPTSEIPNCGRMSTTELSNVGVSPHACNFPNFRMEELYFSPGLRMQGGLFFCGAVTMQSGGNLCLSFGHVEPIITESEGILFAERVIETLQLVCGFKTQ